MAASRVTTVVISHNRLDDLRRSLPRHEPPVVLVDNASTDGTADVVQDLFPDVRVVRLPANLGATARNLGVEQATTPYVAFADDDSWWAPDALRRAADLLERHPRVALVAARILLGDECREDPLSAIMSASPLPAAGLPGRPVLGFASCGAVVRRTAFLEAGGYDRVVFFAGEESRLALDLAAAGWELRYVPELVAHHHPSARRDNGARPRLVTRNALLTAAMRRPWPVVARLAGDALRSSSGTRGLLAALPRLPAALAARRPVPPDVEARMRLLER